MYSRRRAASAPLRIAQSKKRMVLRLAATRSATGLVGSRMKVGLTIGHTSSPAISTRSAAKPGLFQSAWAAAARKFAISGFTKRPDLLRSCVVIRRFTVA